MKRFSDLRRYASWLEVVFKKEAIEDAERRSECEEAGEHKDIHWGPYSIISKSDPLRDKVNGHCGYCYTRLQRSLNDDERNQIREFREMMYRPMTI